MDVLALDDHDFMEAHVGVLAQVSGADDSPASIAFAQLSGNVDLDVAEAQLFALTLSLRDVGPDVHAAQA